MVPAPAHGMTELGNLGSGRTLLKLQKQDAIERRIAWRGWGKRLAYASALSTEGMGHEAKLFSNGAQMASLKAMS